jgi:OST-HTH/LOTUS domain
VVEGDEVQVVPEAAVQLVEDENIPLIQELQAQQFPDLRALPDTDADAVIVGSEAKQARPTPSSAAQLKSDTTLVALLRNAVEAASDDDGWAPLSSIGNIITNQRPDFDARSYGYAKLSDLITATTLFEMDRRSPGDGKQAIIYARVKRRAQARKARPLTD